MLGFKFCYNCSVKSSKISENIPGIIDEEEDIDVDDEFRIATEDFTGEELPRELLDSSLVNLGESLVKLHSLSSHRRIPVAKGKFDKAVKKLEEKFACAYGVDVSDLQKDQLIDTDIVKKAVDLDRLTLLMKGKIKISSFNETVQILTMAPESWSREYAAQYFLMSQSTYLVHKACSLKSENGVFSLPDKQIGKKLSHEVVGLVQNFYQDDEYSRMSV